MKKKFNQVFISILIFVMLMTTTLSGGTTVYAASKPKKEVQEAMAAYKRLLEGKNYVYENSDYSDKVDARYFTLIDVNKDDMPELLVSIADNSDKECLNMFTYEDGKLKWIYNSMVIEEYYYSEKTKSILAFYSYKDREMTSVYTMDKESTGGMTEVYSSSKEKNKYRCGNKTISKAENEKRIKKYMPGKKKVQFTYENNKTNRDKYLK